MLTAQATPSSDPVSIMSFLATDHHVASSRLEPLAAAA